MGWTLRQAADECGKSRSTIHRALQSGKLSGNRNDDGSWDIDPSELARVFPWDTQGHAQRDTAETAGDGENSNAQVLAVKVEMLEEQLGRERETVEDLRRRLDKAEERAFALAAPYPREVSETGLRGRLRTLWRGGDV